MSKRRLVTVLSLVALGCSSALVTRTSDARPASSVVTCGVERWAVKTLKDHPLLRKARITTIRFLVTRPMPSHIGGRRLPFEHSAFTIRARVTLVRPETDGDLHIVLQDGLLHMIAEAPNPACTKFASPGQRRAMIGARSKVRLCSVAKVTGVAFFDFDHGQTGVAPNAIELHPILGFHCLRA